MIQRWLQFILEIEGNKSIIHGKIIDRVRNMGGFENGDT